METPKEVLTRLYGQDVGQMDTNLFNQAFVINVAQEYGKQLVDPNASKIRMQYAGVVGMLCDLHLTCRDEEQKDLIRQAINDWCDITGWGYIQILDRIELTPPKE